MDRYDGPGHVNIGTGEDEAIREIAEMVRDTVHPEGELAFDTSKPDGMPRKVLDVARLHALGWHHKIALRDGIRSTYQWFLEQDPSQLRGVGARTAPAA